MIDVFNPNPVPITYDSDGHVAPALQHIQGDPTDPVTAQLLESGTLVGTGADQPTLSAPRPVTPVIEPTASDK